MQLYTFEQAGIIYNCWYNKVYSCEAEIVFSLWGDNKIQKLLLRGMVDGKNIEVQLEKVKITRYKLDEYIRKNFRIFNPNNEE